MALETWKLSGDKKTTGGTNELGFVYRTLTDGRSEGIRMVSIHAADQVIDILPTRGMSIHCVRKNGLRFGWDSPIDGPIHPRWVPISEPSGLGWLDGFDEMLVRCGLQNNGAPQHSPDGVLQYPLHGRIGNLPAQQLEMSIDSSKGTLQLKGHIFETRFHFCKLKMTTTYSLELESPNRLLIHDKIENLSNRNAEIQMLYHTNMGSPILEQGACFVAPVEFLCPRNEHSANGIDQWNRYAGPDAKFQEEVFFMKLKSDASGMTTVLIHNKEKSSGFHIDYNVSQLPCFTLWKNTVGESDGYVTGLEPGTNFPNRHQFEKSQDRVVELYPKTSMEFELALGFLDSTTEVNKVVDRIAQLKTDSPTISRSPTAPYCELE